MIWLISMGIALLMIGLIIMLAVVASSMDNIADAIRSLKEKSS